MNYFCTLFNSNYMLKGLAMISSLQEKARTPYQLYVLAMDDETKQILGKLGLPSVKVISLEEFENADLLAVKKTRSFVEYCWTCTPAIVRYVIEQYAVPECTYLDADLFFFNDPEILLTEVRSAQKSVLITPHNYSFFFDQTKRSGIFCVQFMYFKSDSAGRIVLEDWYQKCLEWCYARVEPGKFGDQKYLDFWPAQFPESVHRLRHRGTLAPWNIQGARLNLISGFLECQQRGHRATAIFYHFHGLQILKDGSYFEGWYPLSANIREMIYAPYLLELEKWKSQLSQEMGRQIQALSSHQMERPINHLKSFRLKILEKVYDFLP